jgi:hypothetical protein
MSKLTLHQRWILFRTDSIINNYLNSRVAIKRTHGIDSAFEVETTRNGIFIKRSFKCNGFEFGYYSEVIDYGYFIAHDNIIIYKNSFIHKLPTKMLIEIASNLQTISHFTKKLKQEMKTSPTLEQKRIAKEQQILASKFKED